MADEPGGVVVQLFCGSMHFVFVCTMGRSADSKPTYPPHIHHTTPTTQTNQVLLYQTHLALSADALGSRHATVGATPFDLGLHGGEKYRPPLEIAQATEEATYECRIHGEVSRREMVETGRFGFDSVMATLYTAGITVSTDHIPPQKKIHPPPKNNQTRWSREARWWPRAAAGARPSGCGSPT